MKKDKGEGKMKIGSQVSTLFEAAVLTRISGKTQ